MKTLHVMARHNNVMHVDQGSGKVMWRVAGSLGKGSFLQQRGFMRIFSSVVESLL